jgi:hypothetical protein
MAKSMVAQIAELERMPLEKLREKWEALFNTKPPVTANSRQLIVRLAYRLQELVYGGLSADARDRLEQLAEARMGASPKITSRKTNRPIPGTRFLREWNGERYEVTVLERGFEYQGRAYQSLTAIATAITGTKWNGPSFFGLRQQGAGDSVITPQHPEKKCRP